ncbi:hypothetical protein, partial [Nocardia mangyaensis]|uniref:hypothetical protein n=1 Tax=Nocardia mangyaensis TaxID=2213200 RepID=UPI0026768445
MIVLIFQDFINIFKELSKANPFVAGVVSAWLLGVLSYLCRDVPSRILAFLEKQFTVTLTIPNSNDIFVQFLEWYDEEGFGKHSRTLRHTEKYDRKRGVYTNVLSAGLGSHYFWHKWRPYRLVRSEKDTLYTDPKETITIVTIGRSQECFRNLIRTLEERASRLSKEEKYTKHYIWTGDWEYSHKQVPRPLDSVVLPEDQKLKLLNAIQDFQDQEQWYIDNGIPYRMVILL